MLIRVGLAVAAAVLLLAVAVLIWQTPAADPPPISDRPVRVTNVPDPVPVPPPPPAPATS